jgi:hypothetical protein
LARVELVWFGRHLVAKVLGGVIPLNFDFRFTLISLPSCKVADSNRYRISFNRSAPLQWVIPVKTRREL